MPDSIAFVAVAASAAKPLPRAFLISVLLAFLAVGQTTSAGLSGTITDPSGKVVPAAEIAVTDTGTGVSISVKSNSLGIYSFTSLPPAHYELVARKQGFKETKLTGITLEVADSAVRDIQLELGAVSETIAVPGGGVNVNTSDGSVSTVISRDFVDEIPLNGRTLQNLLPLSPGVAADYNGRGYSVNGTRDSGSTNWTVDGVSGNITTNAPGTYLPDSFGAATTALGTTQSLVSLDALQEFRVSTGSYGVEYGAAPGAQVQLESRSGANRFHGSAYDYLRNEDLDANNWFSNRSGIARPPERQNDFGGTFSGPFIIPHVYHGRDKAFFFFNFEDLRLLQPTVLVDQPTPTAAYRQSAPAVLQPFLNALPLPNGPSIGNGWATWTLASSQPSFTRSWSTRGDYAWSESVRLFARVNWAPSDQHSIGNAYQSDYRLNTLTTTIGAIVTPTPSISNDLRLNYSQQALASLNQPLGTTLGSNSTAAAAALTPPAQFAPAGTDYLSNVVFSDLSFGGSATVEEEQERYALHQWNLVDRLTWHVGRHQLKFGGDWNRHAATQKPVGYEETFEFETLADIQSATATYAVVAASPFNVNNIITRSDLYVGDTWKVNKRLSLDYGLRWELAFPAYSGGPYVPLYVNSLASPSADPSITQGRTQWNMSWRNFAPRLGIAYLLRNAANFETVLRTGGGLFYSTELPYGVGDVGYPDSTSATYKNQPYPFTTAQLTPPPTGIVTADGLANASLLGFNPHLALPRVWQWNLSLEQRLGRNQTFTTSYVGSAGRRLFNFPLSFPDSGVIEAEQITTNGSRSDYNALQLKFDRHLTSGLRTLVSYGWSHAIDNVSVDTFTYQPLWGNSDFDIRHTVSVAAIYSVPRVRTNRLLRTLASGWDFSSNFNARTGEPINNLFPTAKFLPNGTYAYVLADLVPGVPVYLHGSQYPGGTALNRAAFTSPPAGTQGDVPRNAFRNQGFWQLDSSLQRKFVLGEKAGLLRLRVDAFNLLNHPDFAGYFVTKLTKSPLFGTATSMANAFGGSNPIYNSGGPRSLQVSLRYEF